MAKATNTQATTTSTNTPSIDDLVRELEEAKRRNAELVEKIQNGSDGRKTEVLEYIKKNPSFTTDTIAESIGITGKNVSSILNALKKLNHRWLKDGAEFIYVGKMTDAKWASVKKDLAFSASVTVKKVG